MKANSRRFFYSVEAIGEKSVAKWVMLAIYLAVVIFLASRHEPWSDEYHVWNMVYNMSFGELIDAMRVEGHFCLWHLCVLPWVKLFGMDYHALYMASIPLMSIAAWLLLFKVDFSFWGKLFIVFSAPFIYHFPVIARCYALIPPIVVAIVAVYQRKSSPYLYCLLIGLLAHTHAYMEGLVAILWILFVYRYVIQLWNSERARAQHNLVASGITVLLVFLAFIQIAGGITDAANGVGPAFRKTSSEYSWVVNFFSYHRLKLFHDLRILFGSWIPNLDLAITFFIYYVIAILIMRFVCKQGEMDRIDCWLIMSMGLLWQIFFAINIYYMMFQRIILVFIPVLAVVGMGYSRNMTCYAVLIPLLFWLINTPCQHVVVKDIFQEYSHDTRCVAEMEKILPDDAVVLTTGGVSSVWLMQRKVEYLEPIRNDSLVTIESIRSSMSSITDGDVFLISSLNIEKADSDMSIVPVYSGIEGNGEISGYFNERPFSMYKITRHETDY